MELPLFVVDAFSSRVFGGNPAGVVPLEKWLPDSTLQAIAAENNLAETAFFVAEPGGLRIRWMTPLTEVELCGHATLASAFVLMHRLEPGRREVSFASRSGPLTVRRDGELLAMELPAWTWREGKVDGALAEALGAAPRSVLESDYRVCVFEDEAAVRGLIPDFVKLRRVDGGKGVVCTAPGEQSDFVSRFFAPSLGIDEDPVTGSAHCVLTPYWAEQLGKKELSARQISRRGGELVCRLDGKRVTLLGHAALYAQGKIFVPDV